GLGGSDATTGNLHQTVRGLREALAMGFGNLMGRLAKGAVQLALAPLGVLLLVAETGAEHVAHAVDGLTGPIAWILECDRLLRLLFERSQESREGLGGGTVERTGGGLFHARGEGVGAQLRIGQGASAGGFNFTACAVGAGGLPI